MTDPADRLTTALAERYRIEHALGAGGMATVYLAHDLKHERKVALKVLRPELAAVLGADRFVNEIRVTANLQHPHILPLFDSGEAGGFLFYVMPYVEGESLRDKLNREKQLGVEQAVRLAVEVASALDYAHRHGVVHRDIKPANIMLQDGQALVADFGIALALRAAGGDRLTETGLSLGTPHYMSPEQATGDRDIDGRTDIYSLGAVLYEMLAGEPPHTGGSIQAVISKVVTEEPRPVIELRHTVPLHVAMAIEKALSKVAPDRFASAAEFAEALKNPGFTLAYSRAAVGRTGVGRGARRAGRWVPWAVAGAAVAGALLGWADRAPPPATVRVNMTLSGLTASGAGAILDISPDGALLAYRGSDSATGRLYLRALNQLHGRAVPGTQNVFQPNFSPDGRFVAYWDGALRKVAVAGGPPILLTDSAAAGSFDWGNDGFVYFTLGDLALGRVPQDGGPVERLTALDSAGEVAHAWPDALPTGRGVIFTLGRGSTAEFDIAVLDLQTRERRILLRGTYARYAASGHLIFVRADGAMLAAPFDAGRLEVTGAPVPLVEHVLVDPYGAATVAASRTGTLLYQIGAGERGLVIVDRGGREQLFRPDMAEARYPRGSPDGGRIAMEIPGQGGTDVWIFSRADSTLTRLTFDADNTYPVWNPDGRHVLFATALSGGPTGVRDFYRRPADGSGGRALVFEKEGSQQEILTTPDGRWLIYREGDVSRSQNADIYYVAADGEGEHRPLVVSRFNERGMALSPDGRWLAYTSNESGRDEVYVRPFPAPEGRWQVSTGGGSEPRWAHSGREVFYRTATHLMVTDVELRPTFAVRNRRPLFPATVYQINPNHGAYDVLLGDQEFVFIKTGAEKQELVMVLNWFEELKGR